MTNSTKDLTKQINNLCNKIKSQYPHLYQQTGTKLIRKTLIRMLEANAAPFSESPLAVSDMQGNGSYELATPRIVRQRVRRYKHAQKAA
jgi:hypothetical protein